MNISALDKEELFLLALINESDKGNGVSAPTIDRLFYDKRLADGCPLEDLYSVQWLPKTINLEKIGLIQKQGMANKITNKGREFLQKYNESQA